MRAEVEVGVESVAASIGVSCASNTMEAQDADGAVERLCLLLDLFLRFA
jgi:hypothetical protein